MAQNDCSLLINSCDAYSDVWDPFFKILRNRWKDLNMPVYLNAEKKKCKSDYVDVKTINYNGRGEWGSRLINALRHIETEFVLVLMEDFFFQEDVNTAVIYNCLEYMRNDGEISCMSLLPVGKHFHELEAKRQGEYSGFVRRDNDELYILCCEPAMWRRKDLIYFTREWQTPWIWEAYGHYYVRKSQKKFYCRLVGQEDVFTYDVFHGGAIHRGKWVGCTVRKILEDNDISIDLNQRGVVEDWIEEEPEEKIGIVKKIKNWIFLIRSLLA